MTECTLNALAFLLMNLAACLCTLSNLLISILVNGSHTVAAYSSLDLTKEQYANFLQSRGQFLKFRCKNPTVDEVFL